jgi:hypothetical protein
MVSCGKAPQYLHFGVLKCAFNNRRVDLVGGFNHLEKYEFVNGNDYPIYEMENKFRVPNHQPGELILTYFNRILLLIKLGLLEISPSFSPMMFH